MELVENEASWNVMIYVSGEGEDIGSSSFHLQSFIMEL